ncbi:MAG TPA: zinc transporter ZupT [Bacteroidales bacterium]|nr:zinc transporter ZupT [Bacteroidales bacterium]
MTTENFWFAFALTVFAGLSTGIGSALAFFTKKTNTRLLSASLGFSAGVMIYVSFMEIMVKSNESLVSAFGDTKGAWMTVASFFAGVLVIALIDKLIPSYENPHEIKRIEDVKNGTATHDPKLVRMGLFTALAIAIHNFPEGIATFFAGLSEPELAVPVAIAIAIHNIPEGIAVSVPVSYGTGNKKRGFFLSLLSGLAEPVGALFAFAAITIFFTNSGIPDSLFGYLFGGVAGIMVFISIDELLPTAEEYGYHHYSIYGFIIGMAVMALSLLLFL